MDKASETLSRLKPVIFKFNSDWKATTQYGLIAEEVAEVDSRLVVHDKNGEVTAVHYEQISNMLLNEFLKEHKKVEEQQASISQLKSEMQTMVAQLKEQAAQIQKVSAQLRECMTTAPRTVANANSRLCYPRSVTATEPKKPRCTSRRAAFFSFGVRIKSILLRPW